MSRMAFFVRILAKSARDRLDGPLFGFDLSEEELWRRVVDPYRTGRPVTLHGRTLEANNVSSVRITRIDNAVADIPLAQLRQAWKDDRKATGEWIATRAQDVTDKYIQGEPGGSSSASEPALMAGRLQRGWLGRIGGAFFKLLAAVAAHPLIAASVGGVIAGLVVFWITTGSGNTAHPVASSREPCAPAGPLRGPGTHVHSDLPADLSSGQIEGGDILRISQLRRDHFVHSMTVVPGTRLLVGLKYVNPGPGEVGGVNVKVSLPRSAGRILKLRGTIDFDGALNPWHSIATIYVKLTDACARYVPGSTVEVWRYPNGYKWRNPISDEDHIVSRGGLYLGGIPQMKFRQARYIYFEIEVI